MHIKEILYNSKWYKRDTTQRIHSFEFPAEIYNTTFAKMSMNSKDFELSPKTSLFVTRKAKSKDYPYAALCRKKSPSEKPNRFFYMSLNNILQVS